MTIEEINKNIFQNGPQNLPTAYRERCGMLSLYINDSLVNVPKTCQPRCEINIDAYLFHNIVYTLSQRYVMTQHVSNVV